MNVRLIVLLGLVALGVPSCTVYATRRDVGTVAADGSVYLGWHLLSSDHHGGSDHEDYPVGQQLGGFSSLRLHADDPLTLQQVLVVFADGERFVLPAPTSLAKDQWTNPIALPRSPRPIHSIAVAGRAAHSQLSQLEIYGIR